MLGYSQDTFPQESAIHTNLLFFFHAHNQTHTHVHMYKHTYVGTCAYTKNVFLLSTHQLCVYKPAKMEVHALALTLAPVQVSGLDQTVLYVSTYLCTHAGCMHVNTLGMNN